MLNQVLVAHGMYTSSVANKNTVYTSDYTLSANEGIVTNTTGGSFTVKLPSNPGIGAQNYVFDGASWATVNLFIDPQTAAIEDFAVSEILKVDVSGGGLQFLYDGAKWKMFWLSLVASGSSDSFAKTGGDVTGNINLSGTGRRLMGLFSGAVHAARTLFKGNEANAGTILGVIPDGTATLSQMNFYNRSDPDNASVLTVLATDTEVSFRSGKIGTANYLPMTWWNNGLEFMRLGTNGTLSLGRNFTGNIDTVLRIEETAHATSKRAAMTFGSSWVLGQDSNANGTKDFFLYSAALSSLPLMVSAAGHTCPGVTNTYDLGSTTLRWRNIYTQDLHLSNGIGDYTVIEGEENLYLVNNKSGKHFKFALIEVDPAEVPAKSEAAHGS